MEHLLDTNSDNTEPASPIRRLIEARWLLIALAAVFCFLSTRWSDSITTLFVCYIFLCAVIAFSRRKNSNTQQRRQTRQERQRSLWPATQVKLFVNAIPEPSVVLDGDGVIRHSNEPMREAFGSISQGDPFTLKFRDPDIVEAVAKVQATRQSVSVAYMERFPTERHYLFHFSPINLPGSQDTATRPDFIFVVMLEQTERYRLEELRSDFIANVSHELRTPIASLTGFIETLLGPARDDEVSREKFLKIMLEQSQRMARLVSDLLSLSRIEMRSHLRPTATVDLAKVVRHVSDAMAPLAEEIKLTIHIEIEDVPFMVIGDHDELVQVIQNLMENAFKYGSDGGRVDIRLIETSAPVDLDARGIQCYMVEVQDYGKGIASEHLPRLTERFYRVDAEESKRKMGTGLGLAVVKHILMRHKAHLKVTSTAGEGASFRIYMLKADETVKIQKNQ